MPINIHILDASKEILPYSNQIKLMVGSIIDSVGESSLVRYIDMVFCYNPGATDEEMGGVGISSTNSHSIIISLNPHHQNFDKTFNNELQNRIADKLKSGGFVR